MVTTNGQGTKYGRFNPAPDAHTMVVRVEIDLTMQRRRHFDPRSGDGSSRVIENLQSIFVDASEIGQAVTIDCYATGHKFKVPAGYQAFLPILTPGDNVGFTVHVEKAGVKVPILLMDYPVDLCVWNANGGGIQSDVSLVSLDGVAGAAWTVLMEPDNSRQGAILQNTTGIALFILPSDLAPIAQGSAGAPRGFEIPATPQAYKFDVAPRRRWWVRAAMAGGAYNLQTW